MLIAQEEYSSGDDDDEEEEDTTSEVAAIATTSTPSPSLFDSPNENLPIKNASCFMAKSSEVSSFIPPMSNSSNAHVDVNIFTDAFDKYVSNLKGENEFYFSAIMSQLGEATEKLDDKCRIERENADVIASLKEDLEEEQESIVSLDETIANLTKERDLARAKLKVLKKENTKFVEAHDKLVKDHENLDKDYKALESENSLLIESNEQLQTRLSKYDAPSSSTSSTIDHTKIIEENATLKEEISLYIETNEYLESLVAKYGLSYYPNNSTCEQANILEENVRLTKELAKLTSSKKNMSLDDLLSKQRSFNDKRGLGYAPKAKKKNITKKKEMPAQEKTKKVIGGNKAPKGKATTNDHAGTNNPNYVLFKDCYGDIYARYVGPYDGYIAWSIWVPKTLVANSKGPIAKWVPKTKH